MILKASHTQDGGMHYWFWCQGCGIVHKFHVPTWTWNGILECPTVSPSILTVGEKRCHLFMELGQLRFLADCTHELAGQKVPMMELPQWVREL